jgi:4-hydroxy-3-polyprenylbenzoate decarboxylase
MRDIREYLDALRKYGELKEIEAEVDWNLEAAAIAAMACRVEDSVPLLFKNVKGYPGQSLAANMVAGPRLQPWRRYNIVLGLEPDTPKEEFDREFLRRFMNPIKPTVVSTGPVKEVIKTGKEVNVFDFPLPYIHDGDGGRYGGTWTCLITKDPDSDWVNWGQYRWMAHTKNKLGGLVQPGQHGPTMYYTNEARGKPTPFCIALGCSPTVFLACTLQIPRGMNEVDFVGGLNQEPVELVKAETNDLLVPAHAEIVLEGEMLPYERYDEGPFGEYDGFMNAPRFPRPVYRIHCITHRRNPIYVFVNEGVMYNDSNSTGSTTYTALFEGAMAAFGWQVRNISLDRGALWRMPIISMKPLYPGQTREVMSFYYRLPVTSYLEKMMFVDEDVDAWDQEQVLEELALKVHPIRGIQRTDQQFQWGWLSGISAYSDAEEKKQGYGVKLAFDATTPPGQERLKRVCLENHYPQDVQEWLVEKWKELGFAEEPVLKKWSGVPLWGA